tara:strand:- start:327 stop:440 length:114 start_codon:yes stop_codon:yes gene_type:complete
MEKVYFNVEVKKENSDKVFQEIEKLNGVLDISEYLEG